MFSYKKFLQYPIKLKNKNPQLATIIATQYGGPKCLCLSVTNRQRIFAASRETGRYFSNRSNLSADRVDKYFKIWYNGRNLEEKFTV